MKHSILLKLLMILCLIVCLSVSICSCNDETDTTPKDTSDSSVTEDVTEDVTQDVTNDDTQGEEDNYLTYTVKVVDRSGAPLAGATVQMCVGDLCRLPQFTDENGVTVFEDFERADYSVKVTLAGYTGEASYHFDTTSTELTVTLDNQ